MISSFVDIQVVFCTLILCASGYYFIKPVAKYEKNTDKTVLITGCDSGFGKGLVISATNAGFNVIAACYSEQAAKEFDNNSDVIAVVADLTKKEDIDKVVNTTKFYSADNGLFGLINNAGICLPGNIEWLPSEAYKQTMDINFHAPVNLTYHLLPLIKKAKGRIINVTSVDGFIPLPTISAYASSKHALESYSDILRCEMLPWGVKVVIVEPATMRTPLAMGFADAWLKSFKEATVERQLPYGHEWANKVADFTREGIKQLAADPQETISAMLSALEQINPPTRIKTGKVATFLFKPLSLLPDSIRDRVLYPLSFRGIKPQGLIEKPPNNVISHLTIIVSNLEKSIDWYTKFGFKCIGDTINRKQFLKGGKHSKWQPLILLKEDKNMSKRGKLAAAGMTRLSLYTTTIDNDIEDLSNKGIEPMAKPADTWGKLAAYKDPDGFIVYLLKFGFPLYPIFLKKRVCNRVTNPQVFTWNFNTTNFEVFIKHIEKLGFSKIFYECGHEHKNKVTYSMLTAFGLSETETIIKIAKISSLPFDNFNLTLIEWTNPKTEHKGAEKLNTMSISVKDVHSEMERLKDEGLNTLSIKKAILPIYGEIEVGSVNVDGTIVELCQFE